MTDTIQHDEQKAQLANDLRRLRRAAELTGVEAAARAGISQSKISKIETTVVLPTRSDVETLCSVYRVGRTEKKDLLDRVEQLENEVTDWRTYLRAGAGQSQDNHKEYEKKAKEIRVFQPSAIPGLLQTPDYAGEILKAFGYPESVVEASMTARMDRQSVLYDKGKSLSFVITESALRTPYGDSATMIGQIDRIITLADLPNIDVAVVPLMRVLRAVPLNQFCMYDDDLVTVETSAAEVLVRDKRDLDLYDEIFDRMLRSALRKKDAIELLQEVLSDYKKVERRKK